MTDSLRHLPINTFLSERIAAGEFPSAVYLVGVGGEAVYADALGQAVTEPATPARLETIYDLASLTKPLVTGLLTARLIELGALALDETVARHLREFDRDDKRA
ncbi:MAG: beta-lactamase family protein, partial [Acidobacteria bacterium]|nr:beta-lactamase family protein [Acidobacteriota bacterium]